MLSIDDFENYITKYSDKNSPSIFYNHGLRMNYYKLFYKENILFIMNYYVLKQKFSKIRNTIKQGVFEKMYCFP